MGWGTTSGDAFIGQHFVLNCILQCITHISNMEEVLLNLENIHSDAADDLDALLKYKLSLNREK